jgi:hypothetical protein
MKSNSSRPTQEDGALVEAVSKAKSKKERSQNKVVLDVADLFAGNALPWTLFYLFQSLLPQHLKKINAHFIRSSSSLLIFFLSWTR